MAEQKLTRDTCIALLREKHHALQNSGEKRFPQRSDFSEREIVAIKAFLGPWPRALEAAEIKPPRDDGKRERELEKRIRAKRRRTAAKKAKKSAENADL